MTSTPLPEQGGFNERLDEILQAMFNSTRPNVALPKAKAAIHTLVLEEIIGEDGETVGHIRPNGNPSVDMTQWYYNELRAEMRKKLGGSDGTK